jgi:DNA polymerase III epsilon subunit-like protein
MLIWGESRLLVKIKEKWGCISLSKPEPVRQYWDCWLSPIAQIKNGTLRSFNFRRKKWEYYDVELDDISDATLWPDWSQEVSVFEEVGYDFDGSSPKFRRHKNRYPKYIVVTKGAKYGLVQTGFGIRIPIEYDAIELHADTVWCTKHGKTLKYTRDSLPKLLSSVNQPNNSSKEYYLFFDTETTGLPKDYKAPSSAINNWPRMIQLSWITTDIDGTIISENDHIIYPDGFIIPQTASAVNGITMDVARTKGDLIKDVLGLFLADVENADYVVGHNVSFDIHVVGAELIRQGKRDTIALKPSICTMESSIDFCAIPGYYGYKYPSLQELHKKLFNYEFEDAHNALSDIRATLKCFFELKEREIIKN